MFLLLVTLLFVCSYTTSAFVLVNITDTIISVNGDVSCDQACASTLRLCDSSHGFSQSDLDSFFPTHLTVLDNIGDGYAGNILFQTIPPNYYFYSSSYTDCSKKVATSTYNSTILCKCLPQPSSITVRNVSSPGTYGPPNALNTGVASSVVLRGFCKDPVLNTLYVTSSTGIVYALGADNTLSSYITGLNDPQTCTVNNGMMFIIDIDVSGQSWLYQKSLTGNLAVQPTPIQCDTDFDFCQIQHDATGQFLYFIRSSPTQYGASGSVALMYKFNISSMEFLRHSATQSLSHDTFTFVALGPTGTIYTDNILNELNTVGWSSWSNSTFQMTSYAGAANLETGIRPVDGFGTMAKFSETHGFVADKNDNLWVLDLVGRSTFVRKVSAGSVTTEFLINNRPASCNENDLANDVNSCKMLQIGYRSPYLYFTNGSGLITVQIEPIAPPPPPPPSLATQSASSKSAALSPAKIAAIVVCGSVGIAGATVMIVFLARKKSSAVKPLPLAASAGARRRFNAMAMRY